MHSVSKHSIRLIWSLSFVVLCSILAWIPTSVFATGISLKESDAKEKNYKLQSSKGDDKITVVLPATKTADGKIIPSVQVSLADYGQKTFPVGTLFIVPSGAVLNLTVLEGDSEVPLTIEGSDAGLVDPEVAMFVPDSTTVNEIGSTDISNDVNNKVNSDTTITNSTVPSTPDKP